MFDSRGDEGAGTRPATLPALTSLRFAAAMAVVLFHFNWLARSEVFGGLYRRVFSQGHLGVPFFFVLSGFVLAYNYRARLRTLDGRGLRSYFLARVARIYPLHLFALACYLTLPTGAFGVQPAGVGALAATATPTQAFFPDPSYYHGYNGPSSSLSIEAFFYVVFPFLLSGATRQVKRPAAFALLAVAAWGAHAAFTRSLFRSAWGAADPAMLNWLYGMFPPARVFEFVMGMATGLAFAVWRPDAADERRCGLWTAAEVAVLAALAVLVLEREAVVARMPWTLRVAPALAFTPVFCVLLFVFARGAGPASAWLPSGHSYSWARAVTRCSYCMAPQPRTSSVQAAR